MAEPVNLNIDDVTRSFTLLSGEVASCHQITTHTLFTASGINYTVVFIPRNSEKIIARIVEEMNDAS